MTGGQMAPTTLPGMKTETTPYGRDVEETGYPAQGPEMVAAITRENAYVARGTVANVRQLKGYIKKALLNQMERKGFSFVEALSGCPTNWSTNAKETWEFIEKTMPKYFSIGEIKTPESKEAK
jgi:2-oxoglutarate ferredoxin oxidoreductase subunit beta